MSISQSGPGASGVDAGQVDVTLPPAAPQVPQPPPPPPPPKSIFDVIYESSDVNAPIPRIREDILDIITNSPLANTYNFVFLYDDSSQISKYTSNRIYSAVTGGAHVPLKPIFLLLHTGGGKVELKQVLPQNCS